ncbi:MAG: sulfite exporter TauE/SafE family protein [Leptospira sp.]|nr:sulfite exporter TauE/SafE family protein [Leptospira sp.]
MEFAIIALASLLVSLLTFFSGFGLGTILMPVFAIFFPVDIAIALTGIVHLLNNIFKLLLVGRFADKESVLRFGIPAMLSAFLGAFVLLYLNEIPAIWEYSWRENTYQITPIKLTIAFLLIGFALLEVIPRFKNLQFGKDKLILGGVLSGFFGGLSGHQGALRSLFLVRSGLSKESFVATGVVIACLVDVSRLTIYFQNFLGESLGDNWQLIAIATGSAFVGAFLGRLLLKKITFQSVQYIVTFLLLILAVGLGMGII